jgi:hypothetical protein
LRAYPPVVVLVRFSGRHERNHRRLLSPIPLPSWQTASIPTQDDDEDDWNMTLNRYAQKASAGVLLLAIYFVGVEEGATAIFSGMYVHEFVHDGRHLLCFPCH